MIFNKGEKVRIKGEWYEVLMADYEFALLGNIVFTDLNNDELTVETSVSFEDVAIYPNQEEFRNLIEGLEEII